MRFLWPLLACAACGDTSHNVFLYDAAPPGVTSVRLYLASVQVHVDDASAKESHDPSDASIDADAKWRPLVIDRELDLMKHEGATAGANLGEIGLPPGKVTQLRLLLDLSQPQVATYQGADCDLDTSRVEARGVKIDHVFKAFDTGLGNHQEILVHFDLGRSMTPNAGRTCFVLAPQLELRKVVIDGVDT